MSYRLKEGRGMSENSPVKQGFAVGTSLGAAVLLVTVGVLQFLQGISAVAKDQVIVVGIEYTYKFDLTAWGWIHLVLGVILVVVGVALFTGVTWARVCAAVVAALSIITNFLWLLHYPWWSTLIIALDIVVIWAVSTWRPERV